jgi:hypothetical protein
VTEPPRAKHGGLTVAGDRSHYEPLPIKITQNGGHHYRQVWRDQYSAVYEQRNGFGAFLGYEAIAIKRADACHVFGKDYPARELYPCNEDWGRLAISTSDLDRAMDAAKQFSQRAKQNRKARQNGSKVGLRHQQKTGSAGSLAESEG